MFFIKKLNQLLLLQLIHAKIYPIKIQQPTNKLTMRIKWTYKICGSIEIILKHEAIISTVIIWKTVEEASLNER